MNGNYLTYSITGILIILFTCVERKGAHNSSGTDSVVEVLERMEEHAFQREKLWKLELEAEEGE